MSVRVVIKNPGQPASVKLMKPQLDAMQRIVGGYIEIIPFEGAEGTELVMNEDGRQRGLPVNVNLPHWGAILGPIIVLRHDEEGKLASLSKNEANNIAAMLSAFSERSPWRMNPISRNVTAAKRAELIQLAEQTDPVEDVFMYAADLYCEDCGEAIRESIEKQGGAPDDPDDESSYDSGDFPKGPYGEGGGDSDSVHHCGSDAQCLNAIQMPDGSRVGAWLGNPLTEDGIQGVCESVHGGGDVAVLWGVWYEDELEEAGCPPLMKRVVYRGGRPVMPDD